MKLEDLFHSERLNAQAFLNGDIYIGDFKGTSPHGKGKYSWSDGTIYDGDWEEGKITGKGHISYPSGARYNGDFSGGYLHGFGIFTWLDGSMYKGAWRMNIPHGLGRKEYSNLDIYEGSWKEGVHEGNGRYSWNNGNTYIGNWKGGKMCSRGVMKWINGDLFDGFWLNGLRHGSGIHRFADGGFYFGMWSKDVKDGKGTFYPAGSRDLPLKKWRNSLGYDDKSINSNESKSPRSNLKRSISVGGIMRSLSQKSNPKLFSNRFEDLSCDDMSCPSDIGQKCPSDIGQNSSVVYEREYMQGVLVKERARICTKRSQRFKHRNKFHAKEMKKKSCVNVNLFDSHQSYHLMLDLQLGIRYTVGKITPVPVRDVRASDFGCRARIRMHFPRKGSQFTPPHYSIDFFWKDYSPMVFRNLREMFKLDAAEYMMSICGDDGLKEISSPGKSGSIFYLSHDEKFVIKTVKRSELKVLLKMLPNYFNHVKEHENTLITKFFGLHRITLRGGKKVRFVVMGNMFCTELRIHRRYDLKGSTVGRFTDKEKIQENTTLKDLDLDYEFHMDKLLRQSLVDQISQDCEFLESQQIIDYSLLLGLHFRAPEHLKILLESSDSMSNHESFSGGEDATSQGELAIPPKGLVLVTHEPSSVRRTPGPHIRGNTLRASSVGAKEVDLLLPGTARLPVQLGVNMPAQANHKIQQDSVESAEIELFEVYDAVLYMGIIDILQQYNVKKKVEHACKSLQNDPLLISVVEPKIYAHRFVKFLEKVFPDRSS